MIDLADIQLGEQAADLGTGDGRIAIALSQAGAIVAAYELDEEKIKEAVLPNACNYRKTRAQAAKELLPGSRALLNYFPFDHWKEKAKKITCFCTRGKKSYLFRKYFSSATTTK